LERLIRAKYYANEVRVNAWFLEQRANNVGVTILSIQKKMMEDMGLLTQKLFRVALKVSFKLLVVGLGVF
jgi:hypothetical protein